MPWVACALALRRQHRRNITLHALRVVDARLGTWIRLTRAVLHWSAGVRRIEDGAHSHGAAPPQGDGIHLPRRAPPQVHPHVPRPAGSAGPGRAAGDLEPGQRQVGRPPRVLPPDDDMSQVWPVTRFPCHVASLACPCVLQPVCPVPDSCHSALHLIPEDCAWSCVRFMILALSFCLAP